MRMNDFTKMEFFNLLSEKLPVSNENLHEAYEKLIVEIQTYQTDRDYQCVYRKLNLIRIEFVSLQSLLQYEQGEKCPYTSILSKSDSCYRC